MHEFGIIQNIFSTLEEVAAQNGLKKITKVSMKIGKLRQVVPDFLKFAFKTLSEGTLAEGAELVIEEIPIKMECQLCKYSFVVDRSVYLCPCCGATKLTLLTGKEMKLESLEGEQ